MFDWLGFGIVLGSVLCFTGWDSVLEFGSLDSVLGVPNEKFMQVMRIPNYAMGEYRM